MTKAKPASGLRSENQPLDAIDSALLRALDAEARLPLSELSRRVGLSAPSVAERIRRMETSGVLTGFTVETDARALGYAIRALVRIRPLPGKMHLVEQLIQEMPAIVECDRITGDDPFLARLVARSVEEMDKALDALSGHAVTSTAVIKGQSVKRRLPPL
ncbi:AsnC family transcriptional regulator [Xaviernesmea oryzae]|uniref:AsnC family transcriptional regulator n=1 Tax=Xaviernesmea oryzae TaxID=464029 RepID=A0A1Q9B3G6_9HYPH|nr:Lrp/AsnC family transcriptional regulator [Xaviernesmea oryzae]OLP62573.1 AsnC family transcriptional regulator [Xaviernesmea oryzae]SEM18998.1 Lrp/AsnC family transcriptional regulator, leucine-responsive regulatory protein [Xaviernesmea oryzae]